MRRLGVRRSSAKLPHDRRGATAVEFATVAPVFFIMMLGIFEFGRALMVVNLLTDAARQGCRSGAMKSASSASITASTQSLLKSESINATVTVKTLVNDATSDPAGASSGDEITVIVSVPVSSVTCVPVGGYLSGTLTGQYTLNKE